jgi:hypothetical protein
MFSFCFPSFCFITFTIQNINNSIVSTTTLAPASLSSDVPVFDLSFNKLSLGGVEGEDGQVFSVDGSGSPVWSNIKLMYGTTYYRTYSLIALYGTTSIAQLNFSPPANSSYLFTAMANIEHATTTVLPCFMTIGHETYTTSTVPTATTAAKNFCNELPIGTLTETNSLAVYRGARTDSFSALFTLNGQFIWNASSSQDKKVFSLWINPSAGGHFRVKSYYMAYIRIS